MAKQNTIFQGYEAELQRKDNRNENTEDKIKVQGFEFRRLIDGNYFYTNYCRILDGVPFNLTMSGGNEQSKKVELNFRTQGLGMNEYLTRELNNSEVIRDIAKEELKCIFSRTHDLYGMGANLKKGLDLVPNIAKPLLLGGIKIATFPLKIYHGKKARIIEASLDEGYGVLHRTFKKMHDSVAEWEKGYPNHGEIISAYADNLEKITSIYDRVLLERKRQAETTREISRVC